MTVVVEDLRTLVNTTLADSAILTKSLAFGEQIVATYTARVAVGLIPEVIRDEAVLTAAADQFHRRKAPNGVLNQVYEADGGAVPVRISRDPFASIKALLQPWVPSGGLMTISLAGDEPV